MSHADAGVEGDASTSENADAKMEMESVMKSNAIKIILLGDAAAGKSK